MPWARPTWVWLEANKDGGVGEGGGWVGTRGQAGPGLLAVCFALSRPLAVRKLALFTPKQHVPGAKYQV